MSMTNPPHPGRLLSRRVVPGMDADCATLAAWLDLPVPEVAAVLDQQAPVTPVIAARLEAAGIGTAHHWMAMQDQFETGAPCA